MFAMLTSSEKEGYAEEATIQNFGSIIGKTIESCEEEECYLEVIVGLR